MRFALQTMRDYEPTLELARWAEAAGAQALSVADHYVSGRDVSASAVDQIVLLGGIARETSTLELGTLVSPLTFRHPAVMWKSAVTLDQMTNGRFSLGVGTGWLEEEHEIYGLDFPTVAERFARLEEALGYLRAAMADDAPGFEGRFYRLASFTSNPRPQSLRLVVGGTGRSKTPALAGRFADEFNAFIGPALAERVETAKEVAGSAGRESSSLTISTAFPDVVGRTQAEYEDVLSRLAAERNRSPDHVAARLDELGIPHGTPERVADGVARLAEAGVEMIYLQVARQDLDAVKRSWEVFAGA